MQLRHLLPSIVPLLLATLGMVHAEDSNLTITKDISYCPSGTSDSYELERCKLDTYLPSSVRPFPIMIWFHGGGLTGGNRSDSSNLASAFAKNGIGVVLPSYRLSPQVSYPTYIQDAAHAVAWVVHNQGTLGYDPKKLFVGGHSAGAYLSFMLCMNPQYLKANDVDLGVIAGFIPLSGETMTHFTVRQERGIDSNHVMADEAAPIYYCRKDTPPIFIVLGDHDWPARLEENQYFVAMLKSLGNQNVSLEVIPDRTHGSIAAKISEPNDPCFMAINRFIKSSATKDN